jgi:hypothetical protein
MQILNINETISSKRRILFVLEWADERQELDLGDIAAADTFTLSYKGQTTGAITFAADMTTAITTALEALSNVEAGDVVVEKQAGQVYIVRLGGTLIATGIGLLTIGSPTTFTPGGSERLAFAAAPAEGITFGAGEIQISKNGAADASAAGTVTEIGYGRYYYTATEAELNTPGFLSMVTVREDIAMVFPTVMVSTRVLRSCTLQEAAADRVRLDAAAPATGDLPLPCLVNITEGTGFGQGPRYGTAYNGVTKDLTVTPEWVVIPDSTTKVELDGALPVASAEEAAEVIAPVVLDEVTGGTAITIDDDGSVVSALARRRAQA